MVTNKISSLRIDRNLTIIVLEFVSDDYSPGDMRGVHAWQQDEQKMVTNKI